MEGSKRQCAALSYLLLPAKLGIRVDSQLELVAADP